MCRSQILNSEKFDALWGKWLCVSLANETLGETYQCKNFKLYSKVLSPLDTTLSQSPLDIGENSVWVACIACLPGASGCGYHTGQILRCQPGGGNERPDSDIQVNSFT